LGGVQLSVCTCNGYLLLTADGLRQDAVRAMVTADGTHAQRLCRYVNTWRPYMQRLDSRWVTSRRCTCDGYSRFTADGTHAPWLRQDVHAWQNSEHALSLLYTVP
jgi:hypothetical protein